MKNSDLPAIKIDALVKFNSGVAMVLNRKPNYKYQRDGNILWAKDGPFYDCYGYGSPSGTWKAFAGRKFELPMIDGSVTKCNGQWWDKDLDVLSEKLNLDLGSVTIGTVSNLKSCYVFSGTSGNKPEIEALAEAYEGVIYPYWDYEKVIKFDDLRKSAWANKSKLERAKKALIKKVKAQAVLLAQLELTKGE